MLSIFVKRWKMPFLFCFVLLLVSYLICNKFGLLLLLNSLFSKILVAIGTRSLGALFIKMGFGGSMALFLFFALPLFVFLGGISSCFHMMDPSGSEAGPSRIPDLNLSPPQDVEVIALDSDEEPSSSRAPLSQPPEPEIHSEPPLEEIVLRRKMEEQILRRLTDKCPEGTHPELLLQEAKKIAFLKREIMDRMPSVDTDRPSFWVAHRYGLITDALLTRTGSDKTRKDLQDLLHGIVNSQPNQVGKMLKIREKFEKYGTYRC
jgi:hypothetical protein